MKHGREGVQERRYMGGLVVVVVMVVVVVGWQASVREHVSGGSQVIVDIFSRSFVRHDGRAV